MKKKPTVQQRIDAAVLDATRMLRASIVAENERVAAAIKQEEERVRGLGDTESADLLLVAHHAFRDRAGMAGGMHPAERIIADYMITKSEA